MTSRRPINHSFSNDKNLDNEDATYKNMSYSKGDGLPAVTHAPIDKLGVPGRWLRHKLLDGILVGTPVLQTIKKMRTPARTIAMKMISFLGTEDFYTVLFLFLFWCVDSRFGRLFGILMGVGFYAAGFLKSLLCLPRPPYKEVEPEEKAYDWALPSHHSMLGTILPWYIWVYTNLHSDFTSIQLACMFIVIAMWSFGVMFSRLYLGVHSPADIVSGGCVGVVILSMWLQIDDLMDTFISQQKIENSIQCVLLFAALLYLHPKCDPGNPSYTDNCCLAGVVTGLIIGRSQRTRLLGFPALLETLPQDTPLAKIVFFSLMRILVGAIFVFVARTILKLLIRSATKVVFNLIGVPYYSSSEYRDANCTSFKHYTKDFRLPPIYIKKTEDDDSDMSSSDSNSSLCSNDCAYDGSNVSLFNKTGGAAISECWDVVVPSKLLVYSVLTYMAVEIVPQIFTLFSL